MDESHMLDNLLAYKSDQLQENKICSWLGYEFYTITYIWL